MDWLSVIGTVSATFLGALFAYFFSQMHYKNKQKAAIIASANRVIFSLVRRINALQGFQQQFLEGFEDTPDRHLLIRPPLGIENFQFSDPTEDIEKLFITDNPNLLMRVEIEFKRYAAWLSVLEKRSAMHENDIQKVLDEKGYKTGKNYPMVEIENEIGDRVNNTVKELTDTLIEDTRKTIESNLAIAKELRTHFKKMHPDTKFIAVE